MRIKLDIPLLLSDIAKYSGGDMKNADAKIEYIVTDSREAQSGDLFVALTGERYDGTDFIGEAAIKGAYVLGKNTPETSVAVKNAMSALLKISKRYKSLLQIKHTVAITGSVGKTTTKDFLRTLMAKQFSTHATDKNMNNTLGLCYTLLSAPKHTEVLITEMGMNHKGEIKALSNAVKPNIAVITNVASAHIGNFGTRREIAKAKLEINCGMKENGITVVNASEPLLSGAMGKYTVSTEDFPANAIIIPLSYGKEQTVFDAYLKRTTLLSQSVKLTGKHNLFCLSYALAVADIIGLRKSNMISGISEINDSMLRQKYIDIGKYKIFDDSYSASPEATESILQMLCTKHEKISAVLSDMLELGDMSEQLHRRVGAYAAGIGVKKLYLIGKYASCFAEGAMENGFKRENIFLNGDIESYENTAEQIARSYDGELMLFKGSHATHIEKIYDYLKE